MNSRTPAVTIGLPYYNNSRHLAASICSILAQGFSDWELLLVDDESSDGSASIARSFADGRIRHIHDNRNMGLAWRLNQISTEARGRFLFRMDADDLMHPNRVAGQLEVLQVAPENTVVGSAAVEIDETDRPIRILRSRANGQEGYAARRAFLHPTVAARTAWFRSNRYSESPLFRRSQDAELWVRTAEDSRFVVLDAPLLFYRWVENHSFDKHLWQAMALLKILSRAEAGPRMVRFGYSAMELAKLQVRFMQALGLFTGAFSRMQSQQLTAEERQSFATIITRVSGT